RIVELRIADGKELSLLAEGCQTQGRARHQAERALRAADDATEIEAALALDVGQVIPRQEALQFGNLGGEGVAAPLDDFGHLAVHTSDYVGTRLFLRERSGVERLRLED